MSKDLLMWDETLFRDPDLFELDHIPEYFGHRKSQMETLMYCVRPAMRGGRPLNILCSGPPGTGKTTAVNKLFTEIEKITSKVMPVYVNCQANPTRFNVFSRIYKKMFDITPPSSGASFKKIYDQITQELADNEQILIVALDDINYLFHEKEDEKVLYSLLRAHETNPGARIGVLSIRSDTGDDFHFDPKIESVYLPEEIIFPRYNADEIRDILKNRINLGFYPDVVNPDILDKIVEYTTIPGDLRVGIDLLKRSALNAERKSSKKISIEDVDGAYTTSRLVHLTYILKSLRIEEKILLDLVSNYTEINSGELYKFFHKKSGLGYTRFYETLEKLSALKLIDTKFTGKGIRGRSRIITLRYSANDIKKRLRKI